MYSERAGESATLNVDFQRTLSEGFKFSRNSVTRPAQRAAFDCNGSVSLSCLLNLRLKYRFSSSLANHLNRCNAVQLCSVKL